MVIFPPLTRIVRGYAVVSRDGRTTSDRSSAAEVRATLNGSGVLHRADHDGVVGDRVMHRGMVAG